MKLIFLFVVSLMVIVSISGNYGLKFFLLRLLFSISNDFLAENERKLNAEDFLNVLIQDSVLKKTAHNLLKAIRVAQPELTNQIENLFVQVLDQSTK